MPDYGVDTADWEPLPWSWAEERLSQARNLWVVTVSGEGRPHALPVWGVWADNRFGFSCGPRSRKARNLAANPQVVVMGEDTVECVSLEGRASRVDQDEALREWWIERYLAKYQPLAPALDADFLRANRVFEVQPERAFGIIEREEAFAERATRWVF